MNVTEANREWSACLFALLACAAGWCVATVLVLDGQNITELCGELHGCAQVLNSRFSRLGGVPLSHLGLVFYGAEALMVLLSVALSGSRSRSLMVSLAFAAACAGALVSLVLVALQGLVLKAFCPLCCASAVSSAVLFLALRTWKKVAHWQGQRLSAIALALIILLPAIVAELHKPPRDDILARVDATAFTIQQMRRELSLSLYPIEEAQYEVEHQWLQNRINQYILENEAKQRGTTPLELLSSLPVEPVTQTQIESYLTNRAVSNPGQETLMLARQELENQRLAEAKEKFLASVIPKHRVAVMLLKPQHRALQIDLTGAPRVGPANAPVKLVVYSDFECPHCAELAGRLRQLTREFDSKLFLAFKYYPLRSHPRAIAAAIAAACAGRQGRFWEYHDSLFAAPERRTDDDFLKLADELGLDHKAFSQCYASTEIRNSIEAMHQQALDTGIDAVPALFLNGELIGGVPEMAELEERVRRELAHNDAN